ncbi:MAG TPA: PDZ domain-containing protein [Vicinamibacterales bacterium]
MSKTAGAAAAVLALVCAGTLATAMVSPARAEEDDGQRAIGAPARSIAVLSGRGVQIGVHVRDLDPEQLKTGSGAVVERVQEGSPAAKAGLKTGDVITEFDGERVRSARHLARLVGETPPGRDVSVTVRRGGDTVTLSVSPEVSDMAFRAEELIDPERFELPPGLARREWRFDWRFPGDIDPDTFRFLWRPGGRRIGVQFQELTPQLAKYFGVADGVLISDVAEDSPAARAGLRAGDVVTAVNGKKIESGRDLIRALQDVEGDTATIEYVREGKTATVEVTLESPRARPRLSARPI